MVSYCDDAPPAASCSCCRNWLVTRSTRCDVHAGKLAARGQGRFIDHTTRIAGRVEVGDVVRHHTQRSLIGLERAYGTGGNSVQAHGVMSKCFSSAEPVASPVPYGAARFFPGKPRFSHCSDRRRRRQTLPVRHLLPVCSCCRPRHTREKTQQNLAGSHLARPLRWVFADHHRIAIRASISDIPDCLSCDHCRLCSRRRTPVRRMTLLLLRCWSARRRPSPPPSRTTRRAMTIRARTPSRATPAPPPRTAAPMPRPRQPPPRR